MFTLVDEIALWRLNRELERWRRGGQRPKLWWRDDDARELTAALSRLIEMADGRPLTLAIVPAGELKSLAGGLHGVRRLTIAQHGVDHINRRPPGKSPCEYDLATRAPQVCLAIKTARRAMTQAGLAPAAYVPPWNQVDDVLLEALPPAGFTVLSGGAERLATTTLSQVGAQLDIMRWSRTPPRFRGWGRVLNTLRRRLKTHRRVAEPDLPIGLLTHHLAHDEEAWRFLAWFIAFADRNFQWCSFEEAQPLCPPPTLWAG